MKLRWTSALDIGLGLPTTMRGAPWFVGSRAYVLDNQARERAARHFRIDRLLDVIG